MLVVDHPSHTEEGSVIIPPFHTGHLGFMPDTEVQLYIVSPLSETSNHCELLVTPYEQTHIAHLQCAMHEEPGEVQRLVEAISRLHINVVSQESSTLDSMTYHVVNMLLDMDSYLDATSSPARPNTDAWSSSPRVRRYYQDYQARIPVHDRRYVNLFENIIAYCGDVVAWDRASDPPQPRLTITPITPIGHIAQSHYPVQIRRYSSTRRRLYVEVKLPASVMSQVRTTLSVPKGELDYFLLSDTEHRELRVIFPRPGIIPYLVHVGFFHDDRPGALAVIMNQVARAGFNILTSLLRRRNRERNIWEAILEFRGNTEPEFRKGEGLCRWLAGLLAHEVTPTELLRVRGYNVQVADPLYPRPRWDGSVSLNDYLSDTTPGEASAAQNYQELLEQRIASLAAAGVRSGDPRIRLIQLVRQRREARHLARVFLSYPRPATKHAELVKARLADKYQVDEYQKPDGEALVDRVIEKIRDCDGFVALWHHDESIPMESGTYGISPWMPFEYGVALALGKPRLVVRSDRLNDKIWQRINTGISIPQYSDIMFVQATLSFIEEYCEAHFAMPQD